MTTTEIKEIITRNQGDIAFVIGNGINRYSKHAEILSWDDLLMSLWEKVSLHTLTKRPNGVSLTEFYDILELENIHEKNMQKIVADLMSAWIPQSHHYLISARIKQLNAPILTTNFEETFAKTFGYQLLRTDQNSFTDFYPWSSYHGDKQLELPTEGFGIWYVNGMINYHRSIRLGLGHYMGCVERARTLLHKGNEERLFSGKNVSNWKGYKTWLHIVFNKSLFIFGLGLEENEIFLRWLLLERMKYFKKFSDRNHKGWYITKRNNNESDHGKKFFLERIGFEVIEVDNYQDIYENIWT